MARSAKLTSIDAVQEMAIALGTFGDEAMAALDELDINVRRAIEWIDQDRKNFWGHEVRRGAERLSEARVELEKALTYRKTADYTPACREERAILDKAKRRLQTAEEKNRLLPHWSHKISHAAQELYGRESQLASWLHGDLPKAISILEQMTLALERYAAVAGGVTQTDAPQTQKDSALQSKDEDSATKDEDALLQGMDADKAKDKVDKDSLNKDRVAGMNETKEPENEDMGSTHAGGKTPPSDEGPGSDQDEDQ